MTESPKNQNEEKKEFISRFKILSVLGEGGMGKVYKAHDPSLNKVFALKVLNSNQITNQHHIRFQQEAKTLSDLKHDAIPEIYNFAISREGDPYLVMEYIEGRSLRDSIDSKEYLDLEQVQDIVSQICQALSYAHSNSIVHRDIKPDNIVITESDSGQKSVKLIDFGISKLEDTIRKGQDMTQTGVIVGSPPYINPEQIRGDVATAQSDIYSLGCVFFELLAGEPPFKGKNALHTLSMHLEVPTQDIVHKLPDHVPDKVIEIIQKCLAKNKEERFQTAQELASALETANTKSFADGEASFQLEIEEFKTSSTKSLLLPVVGGLVAVGLLAFATPSLMQWFEKSTSKKQASTSKVKTRPQHDQIFISDLVSGKGEPREWEFVPMSGRGYWRGGEEIHDSDFAKLKKEKLGVDAQIRCDFSDHVTGSGIKDLAGLPIAVLIVASTNGSDKFLENLALLPDLRAFAIGQAQNLTLDGYKSLKNSKELVAVGLKNLTLPDHALAELKPLKKLARLRLDGSKNVSKDALKEITTLTNLRVLVLDGTDVKVSDLVVLKKAKALVVLSLRSLNIDDSNVKYIDRLPVSKLDLSGNKISDHALLRLAKNKSLKEIVISDHKTSPKTIQKFKAINDKCRLNFNVVRPNPHEV